MSKTYFMESRADSVFTLPFSNDDASPCLPPHTARLAVLQGLRAAVLRLPCPEAGPQHPQFPATGVSPADDALSHPAFPFTNGYCSC